MVCTGRYPRSDRRLASGRRDRRSDDRSRGINRGRGRRSADRGGGIDRSECIDWSGGIDRRRGRHNRRRGRRRTRRRRHRSVCTRRDDLPRMRTGDLRRARGYGDARRQQTDQRRDGPRPRRPPPLRPVRASWFLPHDCSVLCLNDRCRACVTARLPPTMATRAGWFVGGVGETPGGSQVPTTTALVSLPASYGVPTWPEAPRPWAAPTWLTRPVAWSADRARDLSRSSSGS
jgi:hypothetical protein